MSFFFSGEIRVHQTVEEGGSSIFINRHVMSSVHIRRIEKNIRDESVKREIERGKPMINVAYLNES